MKLKSVQINNFRSIKEIEIEFDPSCRTLVGINESGKSNILKALSLMSKDFTIDKKNDLREELPGEDRIEESYIRFVFGFEKNEADNLLGMTSQKIAHLSNDTPLVIRRGKVMLIKDFCEIRNKSIYHVDILKEKKDFRYYTISPEYNLCKGWKKISNSCPKDLAIEKEGTTYIISQYALIYSDDFQEVPSEYLEEATIKDLESLVGNCMIQITKENFPETLFWEYQENILLPNSVIIADFAKDPNICFPLKHMFLLAGITDISKSLLEKKAGSDNQFQNYLDNIAGETTDHFRSVWKEYKIEFSLRAQGDKIVPGVKEKNTHDFARRSDGFKRFVTFLLMVSASVKTKNINNTLLLIDEPEIGLHPSGARFLRDELIRISKNNYVVYSTHSIFMIDSESIDRHYLVQKEQEITSLETAGDSNVADEEVLYNALGYSIFSVLKKKNIIFEGWKDKHLFQTYLKHAPSNIKKQFEEVGTCHSKGVKNIRTITPMIELADRHCVIVSDSDSAAKDSQKLYKKEKGYGEWKIYQEFDSTIEAITGEDFLNDDFIVEHVNSRLKDFTMPKFETSNFQANRSKLATIEGWLKQNGMTAEQTREKIEEIKDALFDKLTHQNINAEYTKLVKALAQSI